MAPSADCDENLTFKSFWEILSVFTQKLLETQVDDQKCFILYYSFINWNNIVEPFSSMELVALPTDDFLETSPGMEYFCRDSCCHQNRKCAHQLDLVDGQPNQRWIPNEKKAVVSNSYISLYCRVILYWKLKYFFAHYVFVYMAFLNFFSH